MCLMTWRERYPSVPTAGEGERAGAAGDGAGAGGSSEPPHETFVTVESLGGAEAGPDTRRPLSCATASRDSDRCICGMSIREAVVLSLNLLMLSSGLTWRPDRLLIMYPHTLAASLSVA